MTKQLFNKKRPPSYLVTKEIICLPLTILEKNILAIIHNYDRDDKHCYATNGYLAHWFNVSIGHVSKCITKLKRNGYIEQVSFENKVRKLKSLIPKVSKNSSYSCGTVSKNHSYSSQPSHFESGVPPPPIIDNISILETTTRKQENVVVFDCIKEVATHITHYDQMMICKKFNEQTVKASVHILKDMINKKKVKKTPIQCLMWICSEGLHLMSQPQYLDTNKAYMRQIFEKNYSLIRRDGNQWSVNENFVTIGQSQISYNQTPHVFSQQMEAAMRKCDFWM